VKKKMKFQQSVTQFYYRRSWGYVGKCELDNSGSHSSYGRKAGSRNVLSQKAGHHLNSNATMGFLKTALFQGTGSSVFLFSAGIRRHTSLLSFGQGGVNTYNASMKVVSK